MRKAIFALGILICLSATIKKEVFPKTTFTSLEGKSISLPDSARGKYSIVFVALNKQALDSMMTWMGPVYTTFINPPTNNSVIVKRQYNVNVYYVLAAKGMPDNFSGPLIDTLKSNQDVSVISKVLLYTEEPTKLSSALNITNTNTCNGYLLDYSGKVLVSSAGVYTEKKLKKLADVLADTK